MSDFIKKLYANENFALYLGIIIVVLIVIFFVVYFIGKIDQKKLEKTRKLEKIDPNTFKDLSSATNVQVAEPVMTQNQNVAPVQTMPEQTQVVSQPEPVMQNVNNQYANQMTQNYNWQGYQNPDYNSQVQNYNQQPSSQVNYQTPVIPTNSYQNYNYPQVENTVYQMPVNSSPEVPAQPVYPEPAPIVEPVISTPVAPSMTMPVEPVVPENNQSYNIDFSNLTNSIEQELNSLESMTKETPVAPTVEMPAVNPAPVADSVVAEEPKLEMPLPKNTKVVTDVFSSVYAPVKETPVASEDEEVIELPKLKR